MNYTSSSFSLVIFCVLKVNVSKNLLEIRSEFDSFEILANYFKNWEKKPDPSVAFNYMEKNRSPQKSDKSSVTVTRLNEYCHIEWKKSKSIRRNETLDPHIYRRWEMGRYRIYQIRFYRFFAFTFNPEMENVRWLCILNFRNYS